MRIVIVGLGLIGGSLGLALKRRRLARRIIGVSHNPATLRRAKRLGAIDAGATALRDAVADADIVVLATPVGRIVPLATQAARFMRPGAVLTDVGSTKATILRTLERRLPRRVAFVGGHPIAGSERRGLSAASATLFDSAICILTPTARTDRRALSRVRALWAPLVDRVVLMRPEQHDRILAELSHLPHLLAYALARTADPRQLPHATRSYLEMTRVAKSDPGLWEHIFLSNRGALLKALDRFTAEMCTVTGAIRSGKAAHLRRLLAAGKAKRDACDDD